MSLITNFRRYYFIRYGVVLALLGLFTVYGLYTINHRIELDRQTETFQIQISRQIWIAQQIALTVQSFHHFNPRLAQTERSKLNALITEFESNEALLERRIDASKFSDADKAVLRDVVYSGDQSLSAVSQEFIDLTNALILGGSEHHDHSLPSRLYNIVEGPLKTDLDTFARIVESHESDLAEHQRSFFLICVSVLALLLLLESLVCTRPILRQVNAAQRQMERVNSSQSDAETRLKDSQNAHKQLLHQIGKSLRVPLAALNGHLELATQDANPHQREHHIKAGRDALGRLNQAIDHMLNQCTVEGTDITSSELETLDLIALLQGMGKLYAQDDPPTIHALIDDRNLTTLPLRMLGQPIRKIIAMAMRQAAEVNMTSDIMIDGRSQAPGVMTLSLSMPAGRLDGANTLTHAIEPLSQRINGRFAFEPEGAFTRLRLTFSALTTNWLDLALGEDLKVLVAEEDHDHAQILSELLEAKNVMVFYASDVGMALEETDMNLPDIAIVDADLPEGGLANYIIALKRRGARVPKIVAMATDRSASVRRSLFEAGADSVITKPVVIERLMGILAGYAHDPKGAAAPNIIESPNAKDRGSKSA
ncbi:ATP-binding response regulator [Woodsholea maritima]|uniref:ATP-binding response regulator n=1 Tax=Woodsholea maritima TaxID=240237 RepID=UPI00036B4A7F|nr:response regulator [Woodsholea maritima]